MIHELKILPEYFEAVASGEKTFELRKDDREPRFEVGHALILREWDKNKGYIMPGSGSLEPTGDHTGRWVARRVTYVLRGALGLQPGYCILGLAHA